MPKPVVPYSETGLSRFELVGTGSGLLGSGLSLMGPR
jgi:hypothetical protein